MTESDFLPYASQSISEDDIQAVTASLRELFITRGPECEAFEREVAEYCGCDHAVVYSNGSAALAGACFAAGAAPGDTIFAPANTFIASIACGMRFGAAPQIVDIDPATGNMDLDLLENALSERRHLRGKNIIVPVHFAGAAVDMERVPSMVRNPDDVIIEDAAHALGSCYADGSRVGCCRYSDMTVFSFHPAKTVTSGEGGMVVTNDAELAHRLQMFRNNGIERDPARLEGEHAPWIYEVQHLGCNYNVTEMQAALGRSQFKRLDQFAVKRRHLLRTYNALLSKIAGVWPLVSDVNDNTAYHLCVVRVDFEGLGRSRAEVMEALRERGIGTQVHYIPLYRHPAMQRYAPRGMEQCPEAEKYYAQALTLPLFPDMEDADVERVCKALEASVTVTV